MGRNTLPANSKTSSVDTQLLESNDEFKRILPRQHIMKFCNRKVFSIGESPFREPGERWGEEHLSPTKLHQMLPRHRDATERLGHIKNRETGVQKFLRCKAKWPSMPQELFGKVCLS
jgi:hypothetical protein